MRFAADLRFAVRLLVKSPLFTAAAVLSLARGIGANTAVFTMLDHVLLRQMPVEKPDRLAQLKEVGAHYGSNTGMNALSCPIYADFRDQSRVFTGVMCRHQTTVSVSYADRNERASAAGFGCQPGEPVRPVGFPDPMDHRVWPGWDQKVWPWARTLISMFAGLTPPGSGGRRSGVVPA